MKQFTVLFAIFLTALGTIVALLGSTTISTDAGASSGTSATLTGLLLFLKFAPAIIAVPYATWFTSRMGTKRAFFMGMLVVSFLNFGLALAIYAGAPAYQTMLLFSVPEGAVNAMLWVLIPIIARAYLPSTSMSGSLGRAMIATGIAGVVGSLFSVYLLANLAPASAFIVNGAVTLIYVLILWPMKPSAEIATPDRSHSWGSVRQVLTSNRRVRRASALGIFVAMLIIPLSSMVVPITHDLGSTLATNAGFLLAFIALGQTFSTLLVDRIVQRTSSLFGSLRATFLAAATMIISAIVIWMFSADRVALYLICALAAIVFGLAKTTSQTLLIGNVEASPIGAESKQGNLAAFNAFVSIGAPIGALLWGFSLDGLGAQLTLLIMGMLAIVLVVVHAIFDQRAGVKRTPVVR